MCELYKRQIEGCKPLCCNIEINQRNVHANVIFAMHLLCVYFESYYCSTIFIFLAMKKLTKILYISNLSS